MVRLLIFLVVALLIASGAAWLADHPGSATIDIGDAVIEMRLGMLVLGIAIAALVLAILIEIYRWLTHAPGRYRGWRRRSRELRGWQELSMGLVAAAAGDPSGLRGHARQAMKLIPTNPAVRVLTAQTALLEGREDVAEAQYKEMLDDPATELLAIRGLLTSAMRRQNYDEALDYLGLARRKHAAAPWVIQTSFDLFTRTGRWRDAITMLEDMQRLRLLEPALITRRRAVLLHMLAVDAVEHDKLREAIREGRKATDLQPGFVPAALVTSDVARRLGKSTEARKILERSWGAGPHPLIAQAYAGLVPNETPAEKLTRCQRLLDLQPNHVEAHVSLAELAISAQDWNRARELLERALQLEPTARVFRLMAEVERASGASAERVQEWLTRAVDAAPDPAWVCESTGAVLSQWQAFGPNGQFDTLRWTTPPKVSALAGLSEPPGPMLILSESDRVQPAT
ncbi:heme biosynthesis protein HemY [Geminicoccus harenae]|uniref:heme biosynthesis protein HemY n=2 Tax=Geminicoccus harenae TaxID=2498453 RepID=UPI001C95E2AC|nr:heme biosynthesis HemY N-terminal domain-containing protein [Geminicoccus harenae]